ncbi:MAG: hypothetical protein FWE03_04845 [Firmicutes bacterium]|nr:hypothetical protein [Bacillota bacterium]
MTNLQFESKAKPKKLEARNKTDLPNTKKLRKFTITKIRFIEEKIVDGKLKFARTENIRLNNKIKQPPVNPYPRVKKVA